MMTDSLQSLSRRDRVDKDMDELFDYLDRLEPQEWKAEVAFNISQVAYEHAYETDDPADYEQARAFTEEVTRPLLEDYHAGVDTDHDIDVEGWYDELADVPGTNKGVSLGVHSDRITEMRGSLSEEYGEDAFEYVVGPFSGGIAPMYAVADELDAEAVMVRYSVDRGDDEVRLDDTYDVDFEDSDVLLVDDITETGSTFEVVGEYLREEGAASVQTVPAWSLGDWDLHDDAEVRPLEEVIAHRQDTEFRR